MRLSDRLRQERMHHHWSQEALAEALGVSARCINCWEQGQAIPQAATRLKMSRLFGVRPEELFEDQETRLSPTPPYWGVSSPRNPFFTGREEILQALHTSLDAAQKGAFLQSYALQGLGGVGKTQVA
ncbi:MAG: helix-turn-helix transcriptional regulator [Ktedonobacteraceae bacterium]|nr:helix-turn-helix transcriptional regulator [Ktedonobacteraceae bacterium]